MKSYEKREARIFNAISIRDTFFWYLLEILAVLAFPAFAFSGVASDIIALTGERTRIVWSHDTSKERNDSLLSGNSHRLMGFDTAVNKGPVSILSSLSNYWKPLITPDGHGVVYSDFNKKKIYVVNWDGSGLKFVSVGLAIDVWQDPVSGIQWVYAVECNKWSLYIKRLLAFLDKHKIRGRGRLRRLLKREEKEGKFPLCRFQLDNPDVKEVVWDKTRLGRKKLAWFQLSSDGKLAAAAFPWPNCGIAFLTKKTWKIFGKGCWTSIAPDNSYRFWIFDGRHRNITIYSQGGKNRKKIKINSAPGIGGSEVYHPRWSNYARIMTMTGPYRATSKQGVRGIVGGGRTAEIYLGRFDNKFSRIEKWIQVTNNEYGDFSPDVWVENVRFAPADGIQLSEEDFDIDKKADHEESLVFLWENNNSPNRIKGQAKGIERVCNVRSYGQAKFGPFFDMDLAGGFMEAEDIDKDLLEACQKTNRLSIEALITPPNMDQDTIQRIITFSSGERSRNFTLGQQKEELVFYLRTSETGSMGLTSLVSLGKLQQGTPNHVIVTYSPEHMLCYLNGKRVVPKESVNGDFRNWTPQRLLFGDEIGGGYDWSGKLEGVAIYNRVISEEEAKFRYRLIINKLKDRPKIERLEVDAILRAVSITPQPGEIAPYQRCLALYTYDIKRILSGTVDSKRIGVYHWVILDGKILPNMRKEGQVYPLTLEPFDSHPQLEAERQVSDSDEFDLPLYYDFAG